MAITQAMCTSFKAQLLLGTHDFRPSAQSGADVFYVALYTSSASLDANTTAYTSSGEVSSSGTNYTTGGQALTNTGVGTTATNATAGTGFTDFADETFSNVTLTARGCMIYNSTPSTNDNANSALTNPAVCVLDFGGDKTATAGDFTIIFPTFDASNAIIRIA
jgi:hypothetical protein